MDPTILDDLETELIKDEDEIITRIWREPRLTFESIYKYNFERYLIPILVVAGISRAFDRAATRSMGDDASLVFIVGVCVVAGGLLGWISIYVYAALLSWSGKLLGGNCNTSTMFRLTAHANIPLFFSLIFLVIQIMVFGIQIFQSGEIGGNETTIFQITGWLAIVAEVLLGLWTLVLYVIAISVGQNFTIGKSIVNMLLPILIIGIPIFLLLTL